MSVPTIKRLDQTVVNRIAAGEIIHRPANALKELIENSLDAGASTIQIFVKDGGLKLLQIQDNGHGIRREDLPIVCERFTTSKLSKFEDLSSIATFGFRGEALASISHVAHVTITTKTPGSKCAFRACYSDGKLVPPRPGLSAEPKPCAGNGGTQITCEDLFYNVPARRKALKSPGEEYNRILDVVSRYAVHNPSVGFTCRKQGATHADVQTSSGSTLTDNIRQIYGSSVATELLHAEKEFPELSIKKMKAAISNANYHVKKMTLLLFINNRLVENAAVKRMVENVYSSLLPRGSHPFVYLSLEIDPRNVDVNVHPTKREVHLLNEDRIVDAVGDAFQELLENANQSRTFYTQTLLPGAPSVEEIKRSSTITRKVNDYSYVRTDSKMRTLDSFVCPAVPARSQEPERPLFTTQASMQQETRPTIRHVAVLRDAIRKSAHPGLCSVLNNHTFVGCVDDSLALIQHETSLYLVNYAVLSEELFYQVVINGICEFGTMELSNPVPIEEFIVVALEVQEQKGELPPQLQDKQRVAMKILETIQSHRDLLNEYFSMRITETGHLASLPVLLKRYVPTLDKLPLFFLRLGTEVDWQSESNRIDHIARELAILYSAEPPLEPSLEEERAKYDKDHEAYLWQVEHVLFPSVKSAQFVAPRSLADQQFVVQLANLNDLYKIFERC